ncbi:pseudouridine synthase [Lentibacillus saliphilus]|uniref:pseudouridine synthase n=1 Tax=Lentibacillus saliphilus TaxID=2737028 RepID=UPI001C309A78|nr:pseudouridine synthase [Lentibacillus saliphilus]
MRLDKLLSNMGYGSRKDVKLLLKKAYVTVNDVRLKDGSVQIDPERDVIHVDGERVKYEKHVYILMNKPPGVISATEDVRDRTVIDLLTPELQHFAPFPVGRLDKDTEGLLLLTNDGKLAHQLTSPNYHVPKTYFATVQGCVDAGDVARFKEGVTLDDGYVTKPGELVVLKSGTVSEIELTITEGKFHQVKRMFESVDKKVVYLKRIRMGNLKLDEQLKLGGFRRLTEAELEALSNK